MTDSGFTDVLQSPEFFESGLYFTIIISVFSNIIWYIYVDQKEKKLVWFVSAEGDLFFQLITKFKDSFRCSSKNLQTRSQNEVMDSAAWYLTLLLLHLVGLGLTWLDLVRPGRTWLDLVGPGQDRR